mgnify:CR=1 FL=1
MSNQLTTALSYPLTVVIVKIFFCPNPVCYAHPKEREHMEKSFYYPVPWSEVSYLREALTSLEIPFVIEQVDYLDLAAGQVAFVFPDMPVRLYRHVFELFGNAGLRYP